MGHLGLGGGDLSLGRGQVNHLPGTVLNFGGTLATKRQSQLSDCLPSSGETDKEPSHDNQWLLWEYVGSPDLVLGIREGFLEEVMAKLKPEGHIGFMLVRLGREVSRQME